MWTADDEKQFAELQARKKAHENECYAVAVRIIFLLKDEGSRVSGEALTIHAGEIRDLLKPFDDGNRESSPPAQAVPFPYKPVHWMKAEDVPDRVSGGHGHVVSRLKRMGPESGNTGYWFVDPDAYGIGPFETPEECEAYIARRYIEEPEAKRKLRSRTTYLGHEVPEGFTINSGAIPVDSMTEVEGLWSDGERVVNRAGNWPWKIEGKHFIVAWRRASAFTAASPAPPCPPGPFDVAVEEKPELPIPGVTLYYLDKKGEKRRYGYVGKDGGQSVTYFTKEARDEAALAHAQRRGWVM